MSSSLLAQLKHRFFKKSHDALVWFGFSTALPDPALWQLFRASLGLFLQRSKRLQVLPVAGTASLAPPANCWCLVCFLAPGWGFPCGIPRAACSGAVPTPEPSQSQPQHAPASLQPITPGLPCSQGTSWVLFGGCWGAPAHLLLTSCSTSSHCSESVVSLQNTHTHTQMYTHIYMNTFNFLCDTDTPGCVSWLIQDL